MTLPSDAAVSRGDVMRRLAELERAVSLLAAARGLEASQISAGGVLVTDGGSVTVTGTGALRKLFDDGSLFFRAGRFDSGFGPIEIMDIKYLDGVTAVRFQSNLFGFEDWALFDGEGNFLINCEPNGAGVKGRGLKAPYIPGQFSSIATPTDSTASGTFTVLQRAFWMKQHAGILLWVQHNVTATTGEIRFRVSSGPDSGTIVGPSFATISGAGTNSYGPYAVPGLHNAAQFQLDVEGRVASGAGVTAARVMAAVGRNVS